MVGLRRISGWVLGFLATPGFLHHVPVYAASSWQWLRNTSPEAVLGSPDVPSLLPRIFVCRESGLPPSFNGKSCSLIAAIFLILGSFPVQLKTLYSRQKVLGAGFVFVHADRARLTFSRTYSVRCYLMAIPEVLKCRLSARSCAPGRFYCGRITICIFCRGQRSRGY